MRHPCRARGRIASPDRRAALLHDIGHLVTPDDRAAAQRREDGEHEHIGADYLGRWFSEAVSLPVRLHVAAKRYLTAGDPGYAATLSRGSVASLELQGGPFSQDEMRRFSGEPGAADAIRLAAGTTERRSAARRS